MWAPFLWSALSYSQSSSLANYFSSCISLFLSLHSLDSGLHRLGPRLTGKPCCSQLLPALFWPCCSSNDSKLDVHFPTLSLHVYPTSCSQISMSVEYTLVWRGHTSFACPVSALPALHTPSTAAKENDFKSYKRTHSCSLTLVIVFHLPSTAWFSSPHATHLPIFPDTRSFSPCHYCLSRVEQTCAATATLT